MTERSKKLTRQFVKAFDEEGLEERLIALARNLQAANPPLYAKDVEILDNFSNFFDSVEKSYEEYAQQIKLALHNLELSSQELNGVNARLEKLNLSIATILDTLGQGVFTFDAKGICSDVYSKACLSLLEGVPTGRHITDVLKMSEDAKETTGNLLELIFSGNSVAFLDELFALLPRHFSHSQNLSIDLEYRPILDVTGRIQSVLVAATDHTEEIAALKLIRKRETLAMMILRISGNRNMFMRFFEAAVSYFSITIETMSEHTPLEVVRRDIHTLKGNASIFYLYEFTDFLHELETELEVVSTTRATMDILPKYVPKAHEILGHVYKEAAKIFGDDFDRYGSTRTIPLDLLRSFLTELKYSVKNDVLTERFVSLLMGEPIRKQLIAFDIGLQELAERYTRKISPCVFTGENFSILTENYDPLFSALVHVLRNIVAHAIDDEVSRKMWGKPPALTVTIDTQRFEEAGKPWMRLTFTDDGCGLDVVRLRGRLALTRGAASAFDASDDEIRQAIFEDYVSTRDSADELAGRGVGMSSIKVEVQKLGGRVHVESEVNRFTRIIIEVPIIW